MSHTIFHSFLLEILPLVASFTVCVILTAELMKYYQRRDGMAKRKEGDPVEANGRPPQDKGDYWLKVLVFHTRLILTMFALTTYPLLIMPIFRQRSVSDLTRFFLVCGVHTVLQEVVLSLYRVFLELTDEDMRILAEDRRLDYHAITRLGNSRMVETIMVMLRRMMLGAIQDPRVTIAAVVFTAFEEALSRSTMVHRDQVVARWFGIPEFTPTELAWQRKIWSASSTTSMYIEFTSIITGRIIYVAFRPHRFAFNFGYGVMTPVAVLVTSTGIELIFECVIDVIALDIESRHGIDPDLFWKMWRANPYAFFFQLIFDSFLASGICIWTFKLFPTAVFCEC